jgi:glyoxylase-like metal-dependent hydrolase (beta-lactamase superfamily II)
MTSQALAPPATFDAVAYPFDAIPEPGEAMAVAPGIFWVRMPLPFVLNHINLWLLQDGDGWTVVDTGVTSDETRDLWRQVIGRYCGGRPVRRVIVTHYHPDHVGLAGWFEAEYGTRLWMTRTEWLMARMFAIDDSEAWSENFVNFYRISGVDENFIAAARDRRNPFVPLVSPVPMQFERIVDGQHLAIDGDDWEVVIGEGHAPEHACLYNRARNILLAGDQILPRISPIVGVHAPEPAANPLAEFLATIEELRTRLPANALVLPAHNEPFTGLHARLDDLASHHKERLAKLLAACEGKMTTVELARVLFNRRPLDNHQLSFAIAETLSHLKVLQDRGQVGETAGAHGVRLFART